MKQSENQVLVGTFDKDVFVRVEGKGTHLLSQPLREFLFQMIDSGHRSIQIDLANCTYMDSTFQGMLVGVSKRLNGVNSTKIAIVNVSPRNMDSINTLGIDSFFQISTRAEPSSAGPQDLQSLPEGKVASQAWAETMLEAHETLARVSKENQCRFKDVITYLKEDLSQIQSGQASPPASPPKTGK